MWLFQNRTILYFYVQIFCSFLKLSCTSYYSVARWTLYIFWNWIRYMHCQIYALSDICIVNIFSYSMSCIFIFLMVSVDEQKFFILMKSSLSFFFFCGLCFMCSEKLLLPKVREFSFMFSFKILDYWLLQLCLWLTLS